MADEEGKGRYVQARLSPQLAELREKVKSGIHQGEAFEVTVTNSELEDAIAWYLERQPEVPVGDPQVSIDPDGLEVQLEAEIGTLRFPVSWHADISAEDGLPLITMDQLDLGTTQLPDFLLFEIQDGLNRQLRMREQDLPLLIESMEFDEGRMTVQGRIR